MEITTMQQLLDTHDGRGDGADTVVDVGHANSNTNSTVALVKRPKGPPAQGLLHIQQQY